MSSPQGASSAPGRGPLPDPERDREVPIVRDRRRVRMDGTVTTPTETDTDRRAEGNAATPTTVDAPAASGTGTGSAAIDRIDELERMVAERTADLQRSMADFQNYKRRRDRELATSQQQAVTGFVTGLLGVLDDIDRAREHEEMSAGFRSVAEGLEQQVTRAGLTRFGRPGDPFDPTIHEALMHGFSEEVDGPTCTVIVQAGYRVADRVVRPARVMVMDPPMANAEQDAVGQAGRDEFEDAAVLTEGPVPAGAANGEQAAEAAGAAADEEPAETA